MRQKVKKLWETTFFSLAVGLGSLLVLASASYAAETKSSLEDARRLINSGKFEQSIVLLEKDFQNLAGNEEYDYLLGIAYASAGRTGQAYFAFERVLMANPSNVSARLKAAKISADRGDVAATTELLRPLPSLPLSVLQQQETANIRATLEASSVGGKTAVRGYILGGLGADSNVTSGPDKDAVLIPLLSPPPPQPPTLTAMGTARQQSDQTAFLEAGLSLRKPINQDYWLTGDGNYRRGYNRERTDVTESYGNLNLGLLRRVGRDYIGAAILGQDYRVENIHYRASRGAKLNWIHALDSQAWLTSYVQQLKFDYPGVHAIDNAKRSVVGMSYESAAAGNSRNLLLGAYGGKEVAEDPTKPHFSYDLWGVNLGSSVMINRDFSLSAGIVYESREHTAEDHLFFIYRKDTQLSAALAADYRLSERWHVIPLYVYTQNTSNAELYAYKRNAFSLQFRWDFDNEK